VRVDVEVVPWAGAELITGSVLRAFTRGSVRPVFCPECRTHFTTRVPAGVPRAPTVLHYLCARCGGDGRPASLEAPR